MASTSNSTLSRYRPAILTLVGATAAYTAWLIYTAATSTPSPSSGLHRSNAVRRGNSRPNPPHADHDGPQRIIRLLSRPSFPLGLVDIFGTVVAVDARDLLTPEEMRQVALTNPDTLHPSAVEGRIAQFYDDVLGRLLAQANRPMDEGELDVVLLFATERIPNEGLRAAIRRRQQPDSSRRGADVGTDARPGRSRTVESVALDNPAAALPNGNAPGPAGLSATAAEAALGAVDEFSAELSEILAMPPPAVLDGAESIGHTELEWHSDRDTEDGIVDIVGTDEQTLQRTLYHIAEDRAR